jgi:hypothetical protein
MLDMGSIGTAKVDRALEKCSRCDRSGEWLSLDPAFELRVE